MSKSYRIVPFSVLQRHCSSRKFNYAGQAGKFFSSCSEDGNCGGECSIFNCPRMEVIGNHASVPFDFFQSNCNKRDFENRGEDTYFVTCMCQSGNENNRCNYRQCPVWNKDIEDTLRYQMTQKNGLQPNSFTDQITAYKERNHLPSLRDINQRLHQQSCNI